MSEVNWRKFWGRVDKRGGNSCWTWQGNIDPKGYGRFWVNAIRRYVYAHRLAKLGGAGVHSGAIVCHHCDNPPCCNPSHLFVGTHDDNMADAVQKDRFQYGSEHHGAKLTENNIPIIRHQLAQGISQRQIARNFGVTKNAIRLILIGKNWRRVP